MPSKLSSRRSTLAHVRLISFLVLIFVLAYPSMGIHIDSSLPTSSGQDSAQDSTDTSSHSPDLSHASLSKLSDPLLSRYPADTPVPFAKNSGPWGLAIYRTYWSSSTSSATLSPSEINTRYESAKQALIRASSHAASSGSISEVSPSGPWRVDPEMLLLRFVDDERLRPQLDGVGPAELRKMFNPSFASTAAGGDWGFGVGGNWLGIEGGIHEAAFLVLDEAAVEAVFRVEEKGKADVGEATTGGDGDGDGSGNVHEHEPWVLAVDAMADRSQVFRFVDGEAVSVEYDGTMRVHLDYIFTEYYWRLLEVSEMSRAHGKPGEVYKGWRPDVQAMRRRHPELAEMERESELWRQQQAADNQRAKDEL